MNNNKAFTLVELSVVIVVMGLLFALLYKYYPRAQQVQSRVVKSFNTEDIDNAILGFAYANGRLPFADTNNSGNENLGALRGTIPENTLGLALKPINQKNIPIQYSVFNKADSDLKIDTELSVKKDRLYALLPAGKRIAALTPLVQSNTIDLCFALRTAATIATNATTLSTTVTTALHVSDAGYNRNVAYVLVDPGNLDADGNGDLLDGLNSAGFNYEVASKPQSVNYDDKVNSMEFSELFGSLACGSVISAALHAHDNVVLAADMMHTSFQDYSVLLDIAEDLADVGVLLADAAILQAVASIADAAAGAAIAFAESIIDPLTPLGIPAIAAIATAAGIAAGGTVAAALARDLAGTALQNVKDARSCFDSGTGPVCVNGQTGNFVSKMNTLKASILANAIAADKAGL